jgi:hypothetical protein
MEEEGKVSPRVKSEKEVIVNDFVIINDTSRKTQ